MNKIIQNPKFKYFLLAGLILAGIFSIIYLITLFFDKKESLSMQKDQEAEESISLPDDTIYFTNNEQIFSYNPKTKSINKITDGSGFDLSPDKTKIAYVTGYAEPQGGIFVIDLNTRETTQLYASNEDDRISRVNWSPDGKHLIVDQGTDVIRGKNVIDSASGQKKISFTGVGPVYWLDIDLIVFIYPQDLGDEGRPAGTGDGHGVASINLAGSEKILLKATSTEDYSIVKMNMNKKIVIKKQQVKDYTEWIDNDKPTNSYWLMDREGNLESAGDITEISDQIVTTSELKYRFDIVYDTSVNKNNPDWILYSGVEVTDKDNTRKHRVYLLNLKTKETIQITEGDDPIW